MKLVIVESPKKCDTIGRYLGSDFKVEASQGHVRDLSKRGKGGLGIDIDNGFKPDFEIPADKAKIVAKLKKAAKEAEEVYLATDPDREGEAISYHLASVLGLPIETTKRLQFHEITKPAILEAMENPKVIDMNLVYSQEARRMYDRIIGFKLSTLLQKKMGSKSAGRVQSVALRMVVENHEEIEAFVPEEYWVIEVKVLIDGKEVILTLDKIDGKTAEIHNETAAKEVLARLGDVLNLTSIKTSKKATPSRLPLTTSSMQQEAYARYKFSTSKTQSLAQRLYEGLDVNGEHVGLITYMRTDSTRISPAFYERHAKPYIIERFGEEYLGKLKSAKNKENAQDAHEAIRPTGCHRTPEVVAKYVTSDEAKLYRLIYERAIASMMKDKVEEVTTATFESNGLSFKLTGSRTLFPGYEALLKDDDGDKELPKMKEGDNYSIEEKKSEQKFTKAPARFTEAKVVKTMEEKGVGRPSTYASTIKTLLTRQYVTSKGGVLTPTESGIRTVTVLKKYFPEIISYEYTANMEKELDEIEDGNETFLQAMTDFYGPFIEQFNQVAATMYKDEPVYSGNVCPKCGAPLVIKPSRYGPFEGCSNYPNCDYVARPEKKAPELVGRDCPDCGKPLIYREKNGKKFIGCSGFPKCRHIENLEGETPTTNKKEYTEADYVKPCPHCKTGHLVKKKGKRVEFLGCTNYPRCQYKEWLNDKKKKKDDGE